jgi:hypothetical protein
MFVNIPKKNTHFITVIGLYFSSILLITTVNRAQLRVLIRVYIFPRNVELLRSGVPSWSMRRRIPDSPTASPDPLIIDILSLRIMAANTKAATGLMARIIDEFIAEVRFSPARKSTWFITTPRKEHPKIYNRSRFSTFSLGNSRDVIQNRKAAITLLSDTSARGFINPGITDFAIVKFRP